MELLWEVKARSICLGVVCIEVACRGDDIPEEGNKRGAEDSA